MIWNFGLGVKPKLTFSGEDSEKKNYSESLTMSLSGKGDNGEPVGNGDSKMMPIATAAASLERSGANSSNRSIIVAHCRCLNGYIRFEFVITQQQTTKQHVCTKTTSSEPVLCSFCTTTYTTSS
jgi:hypothetical protein